MSYHNVLIQVAAAESELCEARRASEKANNEEYQRECERENEKREVEKRLEQLELTDRGLDEEIKAARERCDLQEKLGQQKMEALQVRRTKVCLYKKD